ncbi:MAG: hypothetical protein ACI9G6_001995, partial [Limisphaerales bacterium]
GQKIWFYSIRVPKGRGINSLRLVTALFCPHQI